MAGWEAPVLDFAKTLLPTTQTTVGNTSSSQTGKSVQKRDISIEGLQKLAYDIMSQTEGLAGLATGENMGGGYGSSAKAQQTQDFMVKLIGELATLTAPVINESTQAADTTTSSKTKKKVTVICTELNRQGLLPDELYNHPKALAHFLSISEQTFNGYHIWAARVAVAMQTSPTLCAIFLPLARGRYKMITSGKWNLLGWLTLVPGQVICSVIGAFLKLKETPYGYSR